MTFIDHFLKAAAVVLIPGSVVWLILAVLRPKPGRAQRAAILAAIVAVVLAEPFGMVARMSPPPPRGAVRKAASELQIARLGGIPLGLFVLYRSKYLAHGENTPDSALRVRTWLWIPAFTSARTVVEMCGNDTLRPCWEPNDQLYGRSLSLYQKGDDYWVTVSNPPDLPSLAITWRLRFGVASPLGLAYWAIALVMTVAAWRRRPVGSATASTAHAA